MESIPIISTLYLTLQLSSFFETLIPFANAYTSSYIGWETFRLSYSKHFTFMKSVFSVIMLLSSNLIHLVYLKYLIILFTYISKDYEQISFLDY